MSRSPNNPWLHRFAVLTAIATLLLVGIGGLVTSHEAGMAVPDWPTSYGYNMFLFPFAKWWHSGNVFYEHSHRLFASGVGLLTTVLAIWLWLKESRTWVRWLGIAAFFGVVLQGVLGGLRVVLVKDSIGIFHGMLAQLFFVLLCAIALFTSKWWTGVRASACSGNSLKRELKPWFLAATALILFQLLLGATMRHEHAGLAIRDFPLAYGKLWPATDPDSIVRYNQQRVEISNINPITAFQVQLQMVHRVVAMLILVAVGLCTWRARSWSSRLSAPQHEFQRIPRLAYAWLGLILVQVGLGAATVLSDKAADLATAHVLVGAMSLATGSVLSLMSFRFSAVTQPEAEESPVAIAAGGRSLAASTAAAQS